MYDKFKRVTSYQCEVTKRKHSILFKNINEGSLYARIEVRPPYLKVEVDRWVAQLGNHKVCMTQAFSKVVERKFIKRETPKRHKTIIMKVEEILSLLRLSVYIKYFYFLCCIYNITLLFIFNSMWFSLTYLLINLILHHISFVR